MFRFSSSAKQLGAWALALSMGLATLLLPVQPVGAADHGDGPAVGVDRATDINDAYLFLDPNDNTKVTMILTMTGFIVPAEAVNFGLFDPNVRFTFDLETNGDAIPDQSIDVSFTEKTATTTQTQTATVRSTLFSAFTAPTTVPTLNATAPTPTVTTDPATGISFFAGLADDPFFFDIPGFNRFVASVVAGSPNAAALNRGRDSFAGYNTLAIAMSIPLSLITSRGALAGDTLGLAVRSLRRASISSNPFKQLSPVFVQADRMGNPAINVALIPFARKNEYNRASTVDDANGVFAGDIVGTLRALGTDATNIGILASVGVARGDFLRMNVKAANTGSGGGTNAAAGFPNGRRLGDDVIDTILFFIANQNKLGDNVNNNDVTFRDSFPFLAPSQQPRDSGVDDNTRN